MPRFFIRPEQCENGLVTLSGEDAHHLFTVLRMRAGEKLTVCDFFGKEYSCEILEGNDKTVKMRVLDTRQSKNEPPFPIVLLMALPKGDKMEWIIQKAVELGVTQVRPFSSARTIVRLDEKSALKKTERWQKIAENAAMQCGRGAVPQVFAPLPFARLLEECSSFPYLKLFCDEAEEERTLKNALARQEPEGVAFAVGAEGGFDRREVEKAKEAGFETVSLGRRILRCETAPLCVLSALAYEFGF